MIYLWEGVTVTWGSVSCYPQVTHISHAAHSPYWTVWITVLQSSSSDWL